MFTGKESVKTKIRHSKFMLKVKLEPVGAALLFLHL